MTATLDVGLFAPSKNLPIQRMDEGGFLHVWNFQSDIEKPFRYMANSSYGRMPRDQRFQSGNRLKPSERPT